MLSLLFVQARILYDFEGDTENGELVINEGEEVTVLNQVLSSNDLMLCMHVLYKCRCTLWWCAANICIRMFC